MIISSAQTPGSNLEQMEYKTPSEVNNIDSVRHTVHPDEENLEDKFLAKLLETNGVVALQRRYLNKKLQMETAYGGSGGSGGGKSIA